MHYTDDGDAFNKQFFEGRSQKEVYYSYFHHAVNRCCCTSNYSVLGHIDYIAKKAPYLDRNVSLNSNPDAMDAILKHIAQNGIGLEINTSVYHTHDEKMWGKDIIKRYIKFGGEYVTVGSDAHSITNRVGWRIQDAVELAKSANVRYICNIPGHGTDPS